MKDVIIDFETLGNGEETDDFIVLNVAVLFFNLSDDDKFEDLLKMTKFYKFDIDEQLDMGWIAEKGTSIGR